MPSPVFIRIGSSRSRPPAGPFARIAAGLLSLVGIVALVMMSVVALGVLLIGAAGFAGWWWWKTRALRRALRAQQAMRPEVFTSRRPVDDADGTIIEGELIREVPDQESQPTPRQG